jgi:HSP20 family protein
MVSTQTAPTATATIRPSYNTEELKDAYEVRVFMPGVNKDGITISLNNDELSITGKRTAAIPSGWRVLSRESRCEDYELRLSLNVEIDGSKINAKTENGVLTLTLPKAETVKPRQIAIQ